MRSPILLPLPLVVLLPTPCGGDKPTELAGSMLGNPYRAPDVALTDTLDRYDPAFIGLTRDLESVLGGGSDVGSHSTQITGIDTADEASVYWSKFTTQAEFGSDIRTLIEEKS